VKLWREAETSFFFLDISAAPRELRPSLNVNNFTLDTDTVLCYIYIKMNAQPTDKGFPHNIDYWNDLVNFKSGTHNQPNWYEVRADDERVKVFAPISRQASTDAFKFIDDERYTDDLRDKVIKIVAVNKVQSRDEDGHPSFLCDALREQVIHEEHPTVLECRPPDCWDQEIGA